MKFTCTKENLIRAISLVSNIAGKQTNLPILSNILIQVNQSKVTFATTNLEMAVSTTVRAKIEEEGSFTVPAKILSDYIGLISSEQISLEKIDAELQIASDTASTKIKGIEAEEFPVIPTVEGGLEYGLLVDPFRQALSKVVFAAARNEIRPELSGINFSFFSERYKGLVLASTDSYRLAE
ncbi:MAG: DNA polymerase III subunit beta, partial [Candidatus Magasanikbacteria bacterium CG10_big_fil_rev_8_21_14_0_10_38_6]